MMDKFFSGEDELVVAPCTSCKHWLGGDSCEAFPDGKGIPNEILVGLNDHKEEYPGDHGIQYKKKPKPKE